MKRKNRPDYDLWIDSVSDRNWNCINFLILCIEINPKADNTIIEISKNRKEVMIMVLKETERTAIENLRTQEKSCVEKYQKYAQQAIDPELKNLFEELHKKEQTHYDSLTQVLDGTVPQSDCNDTAGRDYEPRAIYTAASQSEDKMHDAFLATDAIGTEKLVSGEYNMNVFMFGDSDLRKLMADIQVEEQNHAEMLYKYKMANGMR